MIHLGSDTACGDKLPGFEFIPWADHLYDDLLPLSLALGGVEQWAEACWASPVCQAFNTDGHLKASAEINAHFRANPEECKGLYIKVQTSDDGNGNTQPVPSHQDQTAVAEGRCATLGRIQYICSIMCLVVQLLVVVRA